MVEYERNIKSNRIGWVEGLSLDTDVPFIDWALVGATTSSSTVLTDDPHVGQAPMLTIPEASKIEVLACLNPWWAYISVTIENVQYFGFLPLDSLQFDDQIGTILANTSAYYWPILDDGYAANGISSDEAIGTVLDEGLKVNVLETEGDWVKISHSIGSETFGPYYIPSEDILIAEDESSLNRSSVDK